MTNAYEKIEQTFPDAYYIRVMMMDARKVYRNRDESFYSEKWIAFVIWNDLKTLIVWRDGRIEESAE